MPTPIDRDRVQALLEQGAQLVEVLPEDEYEDEHLPAAINLPLKAVDAEGVRRLARGKPVIAYCYDYQWDVSPRAAARLEALGFTEVYDYVAGKADWGSFGLPLAGRRPSSARVGAYIRTDAPLCGPGERMADVRRRVSRAGWELCFVVDDEGVLLGRVGRRALAGGDDVAVEEAMTPAPTTLRPSFELDRAVHRMRAQSLTSLAVTRSDGVLLGALRRDDAESALRHG